MPLDIQSGEIADRLRQFFRLTGRIPSILDETVVPVANIQDLDQPPWRTTAVDAAMRGFAAALAANFSGVSLALPAAASGRAVLNEVSIRNDTGASVGFVTTINYTGATVWTNRVVVAQVPNVEVLSRTGLPLVGAKTALQHVTQKEVAVIGQVIWSRMVPSVNSIQFPLRVTLSPGWEVITWADAVNLDARVCYHATYYPDAPAP